MVSEKVLNMSMTINEVALSSIMPSSKIILMNVVIYLHANLLSLMLTPFIFLLFIVLSS